MTNEQLKEILKTAPDGATHFDGKTYFRFEMYEHGQAYLIFKNGIWDRGLPAYPVYGCHSLSDLREMLALRKRIAKLESYNVALANESHDLQVKIERQQQVITGLEEWVSGIADSHNAIPDWIEQSARSLLAQQANKG